MIEASAHGGDPQAEAELLQRYHRLVDLSPDGILIHDGEQIVMANAAAERLAGAAHRGQLIGRPIGAFLNPPYLKGVEGMLLRNDSTTMSPAVRDTFRRLDGSGVEVEVTAIPFMDGDRLSAHLVIRDITERLAGQAAAALAEERLQQAHEMEVIGMLAGGVAHEVNNMMLVVIGASDFLLRDATMPEDRLRDLRDIRKAADRAATVTRQLLSFSRRAAHQPRPIDINTPVRNLEATIRRLLLDGQQFAMVLGAPLQVQVDCGQIEQVLVNLVLNARDAMPSGGTLTIATADALVDRDLAGVTGTPVPPGRYALIQVRDTGTGIDDATLLRLFEPFFTTKPIGQGTGLGLAAVYGILEQNGGYIAVDSTLGLETTFTLYFPLLAGAPPAERRVNPRKPGLSGQVDTHGGATILVVDDEPGVRRVTRRILEGEGYRLKLAPDGAAALELVSREGPPDLVLTDLMMPGFGGVELAQRLHADHPALPILYMSGYAASDLEGVSGADLSGSLIEKPFTREELIHRVAAVFSRKVTGPR
ncbi:MAG: response regulator [Gemmatimonadota bacterium]